MGGNQPKRDDYKVQRKVDVTFPAPFMLGEMSNHSMRHIFCREGMLDMNHM